MTIKPQYSICLFLMLCLISAGSLSARAQEQGVYRGLVWGLSMEEVLAFERAEYFDRFEDSLFFLTRKNGSSQMLRYDFLNNRLWRIRVDYRNFHRPNPQQVMDVALDEQFYLSEIFGEPVRETLLWRDNYYRAHPDLLTRAFGAGHVSVRIEWETPATQVSLETGRLDGRGHGDYRLSYVIEDRQLRRMSRPDTLFNRFPGLN